MVFWCYSPATEQRPTSISNWANPLFIAFWRVLDGNREKAKVANGSPVTPMIWDFLNLYLVNSSGTKLWAGVVEWQNAEGSGVGGTLDSNMELELFIKMLGQHFCNFDVLFPIIPTVRQCRFPVAHQKIAFLKLLHQFNCFRIG